MNIGQQFNLIAEEYDKNRRKFIPCFDDFYESTTAFLVAKLPEPERILDLGAGTGLLAYYWFRHLYEAEYVLADMAEDMLNVARRRFAGLDNVTYQVLDYRQALPDGAFDAIVSALSVHHLEDAEKAELFGRIYEKLPEGGAFVNYDQFCAGTPELNRWFDSYWEHLIAGSGLTAQDLALWQERRKLDRECSVEQEVEMLKNVGFRTVKCVYAYQKFAVIAALK